MIKNLFNPQRLHVFAISGLLVAGNSFNSFASEKHVKQIRIDGGKMIGKIVEAPKNTPVSFATVAVLMAKDSSVSTGVITDENGIFTIPDIKPGSYILRVTNMGYETLFVPNVRVAPESNIVDLRVDYG